MASLYGTSIYCAECCKPFYCYLCTKPFYDFDNYKRHTKRHSHSEKGTYNIRRCSFNTGKLHLKGFKNHVCSVCGQIYQSQSGLWKHRWKHKDNLYTGTGRIKCKYCDKTIERFRFQKHLETHLKKSKTRVQERARGKKSKKKKHVCSICKKIFSDNYKLSIHEQTHSGVKPWKCRYCEKRCALKYNKKRHEENCRYSPSFKKVKCQFCQKQFTRMHHLRMHQVVVQEDGSFVYGMCAAFKKMQDRQNKMPKKPIGDHSSTLTTAPVGKFKCSLCKRNFTSSKRLHSHRYVHQKIYNCDVCSKTFCYNKDLEKHRSVHTKEKSYLCRHCGAAFKQSSNLYRHERCLHPSQGAGAQTNTGKDARKMFPCDECGREFSQNCHLKRHKRIHTGERPYVCSICSADFNTIGHLKRHRVALHNEATVKKSTTSAMRSCKFCETVFKTKQMLEIHERTHTRERPYECNVCGECFVQSGTLKSHFVRKHAKVKSPNPGSK